MNSCRNFRCLNFQCTRVQWTPSLRESFGFPFCVAQLFAVTLTLRDPARGHDEVAEKRRQKMRVRRVSGSLQ